MTSRELVNRTLEFRNRDGRVPRQLWTLPWAEIHHPEKLEKLCRDFEWDIVEPPVTYREAPAVQGDPHVPGEYTDEWGCLFQNLQRGVIGEVKQPLVTGPDWEDVGNVHIPEEWLTFDRDAVNRFCSGTSKFVLAGACPRPFERLQFIRGTASLYMDLVDMPPRMREFIKRMHDFYCRLITAWAKTDVDAIRFMDDWGAQNSLLISPQMWEEIFRPLYAEYISIAKSYGKKSFMHSDGYTLPILPSLIACGLDAVNAQIFCIGVENLAPLKGKITFWGEIDRQNLLPYGTAGDIDRAVDQVYETLWADGGCIAQCEFGPGANPDNVYRVFQRWQEKRP